MLPPEELNIVSLMDILTTMLFFLILFASFSNFAVLKGSSLVSSSTPGDPKPVFTLKVHMRSDKSYEIWLGPTTGIKTLVDESKLKRAFSSNGSASRGYTANLNNPDPKKALKMLRNTLAF